MSRPDKDIPVTVIGTYTSLGNNMSFNWERYAKDMKLYADKLEQKNAKYQEALMDIERACDYDNKCHENIWEIAIKALEK